MMIPMLVITVKICGWRMFTTRIRIASTPVITAGTIGVLVFGWTVAIRSPRGQVVVARHGKGHPDRCGVHRQAADGHRDHHAHRKTLPTVSPEHVEDDELQPAGRLADLRGIDVGHGHHREQQDQPAEEERGDERAHDRPRRVRRGSCDSSPSELAVSKPYMT